MHCKYITKNNKKMQKKSKNVLTLRTACGIIIEYQATGKNIKDFEQNQLINSNKVNRVKVKLLAKK